MKVLFSHQTKKRGLNVLLMLILQEYSTETSVDQVAVFSRSGYIIIIIIIIVVL